MRYQVLNRLYFESRSKGQLDHYFFAMRFRGWYPDADDYIRVRRREREALEDRGPRHEDPDSNDI